LWLVGLRPRFFGLIPAFILMALVELLEEVADGFQGVLGVSVKHLGTGESASINGDRLFPTASVFKVPVLVEFYRQVDRGLLSPQEQVVLTRRDKVPGSGILKELSEGLRLPMVDLVRLMMILSDNTATDLVATRVGLENVNRALDELGLRQTRVVRLCREILFDLVGLGGAPLEEMTLERFEELSGSGVIGGSWSLGVEDNDVTTPNEMARLLELVDRGEAAKPESCREMLDIMGRCQTGQYRIPKYLPRERVVLRRKTGSLPGIRNDVGLVTLKDSGEKYVLCCFTMDAEDEYEAEEAIATTSKKVYNYFTR